jgi:hypothetical protein
MQRKYNTSMRNNDAHMSDFNFNDVDIDFEEEAQQRPQPTLDEVIAELRSEEGNLPGPTLLYGLSDLTHDQVMSLQPTWRSLDATYRRVLMQMLVDAMESNYELDYTAFGLQALQDDNSGVRQAAIEVLSENDSLYLMKRLMTMAQQDPDDVVRQEAMRALGRYVQMHELGELNDEDGEQVEALVYDTLQNNPSVDMQRIALESIAHCSRIDVSDAVQAAYDTGKPDHQMSALIAMGRTCETYWSPLVLQELDSDEVELRREAAQASGALQLSEAVPALAKMLYEDAREVQERVIWALGEIASREAMRVLEAAAEMAEEQDDEHLMMLVDDALGNASLMQGGSFTFMDFDLDDLNDDGHLH